METIVQASPDIDLVLKWLRTQAHTQNVRATFYPASAKQDGRFLIVPVHLSGDEEDFDFAAALQTLEDTWNDQVPRPDCLLILRPAAKPSESRQ